MLSISSPNSDSRQARSSRWAGKISIESPRARKVPRWKSRSLRLYCSSTSARSRLRALDPLARAQVEHHLRVDLGRADAVDAGHRGDDDHVVALEQRPRRRVPHPVDLLVDRRGFLDVEVAARHIRFRLVVIVIGDEILDGVVREERLHLAIELRRQDLVRREDQRRLLDRCDDVRHREGLARAGDPEQDLVLGPALARPRSARRSPAAGRPTAGSRIRAGTGCPASGRSLTASFSPGSAARAFSRSTVSSSYSPGIAGRVQAGERHDRASLPAPRLQARGGAARRTPRSPAQPIAPSAGKVSSSQ